MLRLCIALWMASLWLPITTLAGWVIEHVEYANPGAERTKTVQYISKNRLKTVSEGSMFIMNFQQDSFTATDQENRVYWSGTVQEYVQEVQKFQQAAMGLARQQMQEAMQEMSPEQRKGMEDLLKQLGNPAAPSPPQPPDKRPRVTIERSQENATIAGYKATKALVYTDGNPYQEVWLAKSLDLKGDLDLKRMRSLQAKLTKAILPETPSSQAVEDDPLYEKLFDEGYPVKIVEFGEGGEPESITEVVRAEKRELPDKEFQPPEGYQRIDLHQFFGEELEKMKRGE